jgi:hypothetical protein
VGDFFYFIDSGDHHRQGPPESRLAAAFLRLEMQLVRGKGWFMGQDFHFDQGEMGAKWD